MFGFEVYEWRNGYYALATPEKALLDLAYLEPLFSDPNWLEEMRFDPILLAEDIDWIRMFTYADAFESQTMKNRITLLLEVYEL